MILGLGIDLVHIDSFAAQLAVEASHFVGATFTDAEVAYAHAAPSNEPARHLAARYAAKEAAVKALDVACARAGLVEPSLPLRTIEVACDGHGRPELHFHGAAAALATRLGADRAWVSLSHDGPQAVATVVVERLA